MFLYVGFIRWFFLEGGKFLYYFFRLIFLQEPPHCNFGVRFKALAKSVKFESKAVISEGIGTFFKVDEHQGQYGFITVGFNKFFDKYKVISYLYLWCFYFRFINNFFINYFIQ